jgi:hypothetical protein
MELQWDEEALGIAETILYPVRREKIALNPLILCLIGLHRFGEALDLIAGETGPAGSKDIALVINRAMADWAQNGVVSKELMQDVLNLHTMQPQSRRYSANYLQCLALAAWAIGEQDRAEAFRQKAQQSIVARPAPEFTIWRYLTVPAVEFLKDLEAIGELIAGRDVLPEFAAKSEFGARQRI